MRRHLLSPLILALTLGLPSLARAEAAADGRVSALQFSLVDLDPGDGLAASATWQDGAALATASLTGGAEPDLAFSLFSPTRGGPLAQSLASAGLDAAAQVADGGLAAGGRSAGGSFYAQALSGHGLQQGGLLLGPMTGLRLRLDYQLLATVDPAAPGCSPCDSAQLTLSATLGLAAGAPVFDGASAAAFADGGPLRDEAAGTLSLAWDNRSATAQTLDVTLALIAQGEALATSAPVPEPATALLWLAAAGAAAARRAGQRTAEARRDAPGADRR